MFPLNPQGIGHPIDVVEVGNHLDGIQDIAVREALFPQGFDIPAAHRSGRPRHPHSKPAQRFLASGKLGPAVITLNLFGQFRVSCFLTEILPVRFNSIKALVRPGDNGGQHFPVGAREA